MNSLKRLCPVCGAANDLEAKTCYGCGAEVWSNLPVPAGDRLPVPWKEVGASLAVGAGALALRAGLRLAQHLLERKVARSMQLENRSSAQGEASTPLSRHVRAPAQPQVRFWGRRVRGRWRGGEAGQVEVEEIHWQATSTER